MKKLLMISGLAVLSCGNSMASSVGSTGFAEFQDISLTGAQIDCGTTSPLVGSHFVLQQKSHGVSGSVRVIDDCTLLISDFHYDGKGIQVEVYAARDHDFASGFSISEDLFRPTAAYDGAELLLRLPQGTTLQDFNSLSIWCTEAGVSFGDVILK